MVRIVKGIGPTNEPTFAFVGEAPGREEEAQGRPFVGGAGRLLTSVLMSVGIDRRECYIDNVMHVRPSGNNFGEFYVDKSRKTSSANLVKRTQELLSKLRKVKPKITIPLGAEAFRAIVGEKRSIESWRGSVIDVPGIGLVLPTYHPAFVMRMYEHRGVMEMDLRKALRIVSSKEHFVPPRVRSYHSPTYEDAISWISEAEYNADVMAFDIETVDYDVRCVAFSYKPWEAFCIPFVTKKVRTNGTNSTFIPFASQDRHYNYWTETEEREILRRLASLFRTEHIRKIAQNYPFDSTILQKTLGMDIKNLWMDTMLVHHACYCELSKSLDFLTSVYTDMPRYSDYDAFSDKSTWIYNCHDAAVTRVVAFELYKEARELKTWEFYENHIQPSMIGLTRIQNRGMKVDIEMRARKAAECMVSMQTSLDDLSLIANKRINPSSPKQLKELLYDELEIPQKYHKSTGRVTTDERALEAISSKHPEHRKLINSILVYRQKQKLLSTFLTSKLTKKGNDFVIKTSYQTAGTTSGRISSSKTVFNEGGNLQQIPKDEIRRMFVPRTKEKVLIKTDLSQAEFRVVAWLARIERIIRKYTDDPFFDVHTWNAGTNIYHVDLDKVTKDMRNAAKAVVHGGNYGLGARTAVDISQKWGIDISYHEMKQALDAYHRAMPEIMYWWKEVQDELKRTRTLRTPFGRIRRFYGRLDESTFRSAYSYLPQSTVGDVINRAIGLAEYVLPRGNYPVLQVHDEIVWEVEQDKVRDVSVIIKNLMEYPLHFEGVSEPLIIPVEMTIGTNWWDQKELETNDRNNFS